MSHRQCVHVTVRGGGWEKDRQTDRKTVLVVDLYVCVLGSTESGADPWRWCVRRTCSGAKGVLFARDCTISDDAQVARVVPNTVRKNNYICRKNGCSHQHMSTYHNFPRIIFKLPSSKPYWNNVTQWSLLITVTEVVVSATCDRPLQASVGVSVIWMNFEGNTNEISSVWFYTKFHRRFRSRSGPSHPRSLFVAMKIDSFRQNKTENIK